MISIIKKSVVDPIKKIKNITSIQLYIFIFDKSKYGQMLDVDSDKNVSTAEYEVFVDSKKVISKKYESINCKKLIDEANEILKIFNEKVKPRSFLIAKCNNRLVYDGVSLAYTAESFKFSLKNLKHISLPKEIYSTAGIYKRPVYISFNNGIRILAAHYDDDLTTSETYISFNENDIEDVKENISNELTLHKREDIALELLI